MAREIQPLSVPEGGDLAAFLEKHIAEPSGWIEPRLLGLDCHGFNDIDEPQGVIRWIGRSRREPGASLSYEVQSTLSPSWWDSGFVGDWYVLRLLAADHSAVLSEILFRRYNDFNKGQMYCPRCCENRLVLIEEGTGRVRGCRHCMGSDVKALLVKDRPRSRQLRGRCVRCGFYESAPIHNFQLMRNSMAHSFQRIGIGKA